MTIAPQTFRARCGAAWRLMFGQGDDGVVCSFCGSDRHKVDHLIAGPGVTICGECAQLSVDLVMDAMALAVASGEKRLVVSPVLSRPERLAPAGIGEIEAVLTQCATEADCRLSSWTFRRGDGREGDHLAFVVIFGTAADQKGIRGRLLTASRQALGLPPPDPKYLEYT